MQDQHGIHRNPQISVAFGTLVRSRLHMRQIHGSCGEVLEEVGACASVRLSAIGASLSRRYTMIGIDVAITIVTYQCAHLTIECLRSIECERLSSRIHMRAVVVDNASGDAPAI